MNLHMAVEELGLQNVVLPVIRRGNAIISPGFRV